MHRFRRPLSMAKLNSRWWPTGTSPRVRTPNSVSLRPVIVPLREGWARPPDTGPMPADEVMQERPRVSPSTRGSKVPEVTVAFGVTKALTTGIVESRSDYLVHRLPPCWQSPSAASPW